MSKLMTKNERQAVRILHVVGRMDRGGAETLIMNVYRQIDRRQVQFDFAVQTDRPAHYDEEIVSLGGRILAHPNPNAVGFRVYGQCLSDTLRRYGPFTGVHSHVHRFSGYVLHVAQKNGVSLRIAHSHSTHDGQESSWQREVYRFIMSRLIHRHATSLLGCSRAACESLFGPCCWQDRRVQVIPNAIDLAVYASLPADRQLWRERLNLPANVPLIGHVGRFDAVKNHRFLIKVFAALLQKLPTAHLVLVGDGPLRPETEALVQTHDLGGRAHLLGVRTDVPQILSTFDLFVFPSLWEGIPITLVEAQAAGVPCVTADSVSRDTDMGIGLQMFVGLQAGVDPWVTAILEGLKRERPAWPQRKAALVNARYDIRSVSQLLQEIYLGAG